MKPPAKQLPARSSRGSRIHKLIGEEAEADAAFWSQDAWNEDAQDSDYESEDEEEDVVDSDFDVDEQPDDEVHDEAADDEEKRGRRGRDSSRRAAYSEPQQRAAKRPRRAVAGAAPTTTVAPPVSNKPATPLVPYEAPTLRQSTARKTSDSSELRRKILEEAARLSATIKRAPMVRTRLTQEELLIEAVRTEIENTQSLNRLQRLEDEKKVENAIAPKAPSSGGTVRYYSRIGAPKTVTFLNTDHFPAVFNQPPAKKRERMAIEEPVEEDDSEEEDQSNTGEDDTVDDDTGEETADE